MVSWEEIDKLVDVLVPQIQTAGPFDGMVIITRGGIVPGGILAEVLDIQHILTAAVSFPTVSRLEPASKMELMAMPEFLQFPSRDLVEGRQILVVDDVWGRGRTSTSVRAKVESYGGTPFTCVLHFNPYRSLFRQARPDFYGAITDAYIIYPWEIDRDIRGIAPTISNYN
jgi:hypothetical protein